ncbi:hypothetical protein [Xanthomonas campestris]|uniref:hypothetical protein n=1 Tax=Xanthomonas campestris TaxID=339 RepID=UPI002379DB5C|nr:hypothetical protein [Xanthomonas campestris]WDK30858.1 hypothetical protein JH307_16570 [Xanthomonas campestris]
MNFDYFIKNVSDIFIEVEVHPEKASKFEADYYSLTGEYPVVGTGYQHQENKWGMECRIYFNSGIDLSDLVSSSGVNVEQGSRPYRDERKFRINNNEFFWSLIRVGYRLGAN